MAVNDLAGKQASCPDSKLLHRLVSGELDSKDESALITHLDQCADCQNALDQQAANSDYANRLPSLKKSGTDSSELNETLRGLKSGHNPRPRNVVNLPDFAVASAMSGSPSKKIDWKQVEFELEGFELVRPIGSGGMGVVCQAREISLDRMVAIKFLSPVLAADETAHERFLREARVAAAINHPNVITIFAVVDRPQFPYLIMEYIDGESLQERLDRSGPIDLPETFRLGIQIADGLTAAHSKGVVHRDVKPANVLIDSETGNVKLSDFGLARATGQSQLTRAGTVVGTPAFMAPELLEETSRCDHRADLFSLGSLLYAMRTGASPFASDSVLASLHRIASVDPKPLAEVAPDTPQWLINVVERLLNKDPHHRFQSARELADVLQSGVYEQCQPTSDVETKNNSKRSGRGNESGSTRLVASSTAPAAELPTPSPKSIPLAFWLGMFIAAPLLVTAYALWNSTSLWNSPKQIAAEFIVWSDDGEPDGTYETLVEALEESPSFARVEIHGNGPFELPETFLEQSELTIAAGSGFQPVILFTPEESDEEDDEDEERKPMLAFEGTLTLEGIEMKYLSDDEHDAFALVRVDEGNLIAQRCRFTNTSESGCLVGEGTAHISLAACDLRCAEGHVIALSLEDEATLNFDGCLISGWNGIALEIGEGCSVSLNRCTLVAAHALEISPDDEHVATDHDHGVKISAEGNVFKASTGILTITTAEVTADNFADLIHWRGSKNLFSGPLLLVDVQDEELPPPWLTTFADWKSFCDESNSLKVAEPFVTPMSDSWGLLLKPNRLDPESYRLRDANHSSNKIGVDFQSLKPKT